MCGVGVIAAMKGMIEHPGELARDLLEGSKNRGQDGYGLSILVDNSVIHTFKFQDISQELVDKVNEFSGRVSMIITHARYPTSGGKEIKHDYIQPFEIKQVSGSFAFAFNGNIVNAQELCEQLGERGYISKSEPLLDTEVLKLLIQEQVDKGISDHRTIMQHVNSLIDGCCNLVLLSSDGCVSISKDRWGFRPLGYIQDKERNLLIGSSESSVLFKMVGTIEQPTFIKTGEIAEFDIRSGEIIHAPMKLNGKEKKKSRCFFEAVYFADEKTILWGTASILLRYMMGQLLAKKDSNEYFTKHDTVVVDVPSSALHSAKGYADTMRLPLISAITKSPDAKRTFIEVDGKRQVMIEEKYIFNPNLKKFIQGKKVILMDDSIVRGSTMSHLVKAFIEFYEPAEVHLRIPSPPIIAPCFYGISLARTDELIAREFFKDPINPTSEELDQLAGYFHGESIKYISNEDLIQAMGMEVAEVCMGCITGKYPTECGQKAYDRQVSNFIIDNEQ